MWLPALRRLWCRVCGDIGAERLAWLAGGRAGGQPEERHISDFEQNKTVSYWKCNFTRSIFLAGWLPWLLLLLLLPCQMFIDWYRLVQAGPVHRLSRGWEADDGGNDGDDRGGVDLS